MGALSSILSSRSNTSNRETTQQASLPEHTTQNSGLFSYCTKFLGAVFLTRGTETTRNQITQTVNPNEGDLDPDLGLGLDTDTNTDTEDMEGSDEFGIGGEGLFGTGNLEDGGNLINLFQTGQGLPQTPLERSRGIMAVFRMLIRSGQINVNNTNSSDEESEPEVEDEEDGDEEYLPETRKVRPPKEIYDPDVQILQKNDIYLRMKDDPPTTKLAGTKRGIGSYLVNRELGLNNSSNVGFDNKKKAHLSSYFFPNNVRKICNFGYKAFCGTFSKDGSIFLTAAQDRAIRIFDTANGVFQQMKNISARDVGWSVLDTAFSPDGQYVAYSSWSESIHICKIYGDNEHHDSLSLCPDSRRFCIFSIAFSEDGNEILGGANDGFLYIFDREINQRVLKIGAHADDVNAVAFADETSQILFSVADDALVKVWDRRCLNESSPKPVGVLAGHIDGITFIDSKHDGRYLITNSKDQSIKLWDLRVFSPQDTVLACRDAMEKNRWDYRWQRVPKRLCVPRDPVPGDSSVMTYRGHSVLNTLIRCRFSPPNSTNQRFIYTGCAAGRVVIYDLLTGQVVRSLSGHEGVVRDVSWHPENMEIVSTSWDGGIGLWTCESQHALSEYDEEILGIHSNPNVPRRSSRLASKAFCPNAITTMMDAE